MLGTGSFRFSFMPDAVFEPCGLQCSLEMPRKILSFPESMHVHSIPSIIRPALLLGFTSVVMAQEARFASPFDVPPPFRRDRLPLETTAMSNLSHGLSAVARAQKPTTPESYRNIAKLLALALGLDPGNPVARKTIEALASNQALENKRDIDTKALTKMIQNHINWLKSPEAGPDGNLLATCLIDAWPYEASNRAEQESPIWDGWIPALASYEAAMLDTPAPIPETDPGPAVRLAEGSIDAILSKPEIGWLDIWTPKLSTLAMHTSIVKPEKDSESDNGKIKTKPRPFQLQVIVNGDGNTLKILNQSLKSALTAVHGTLPENLVVRITSPDFKTLTDLKPWPQVRSASAAALVLANAALTGIPPDATVLGEITERGYTKSPNSWKQLQVIAAASPRKIIVPAEMMPEIEAFLALEKPEILFKHQFLSADNIAELLSVSHQVPDSATQDAMARFTEIQSKIGRQDLRIYIGNRFIKQRLEEIARICPAHLSAKLLFIQASGKRPTEATRQIIAAEIATSLQPLAKFLNPKTSVMDDKDVTKSIRSYGASLDQILKDARWRVSGLERYTSRADRDIFTLSETLFTVAETLEKSTRIRTEEWELRQEFDNSRKATFEQLVETMRKLRMDVGESPSFEKK